MAGRQDRHSARQCRTASGSERMLVASFGGSLVLRIAFSIRSLLLAVLQFAGLPDPYS